MGYVVAEESISQILGSPQTKPRCASVDLNIPNSEIVTGSIGRDQRISVSRNGITVTFSRDARGKAGLCVVGTGQSEEELRAAGEELSQRVVQQYVYQRLMREVQSRGYVVAEETTGANQSIHLRIRHWEN